MKAKHTAKLPSIFIPVLFFILFDLSALALNFWISFHLEKSAVAINLSGRQRMLSQRMTKALLVFQASTDPAQKQAAFGEFASTVGLFDKTLAGFSHGAMTYGGDGKPLYLPAVTAHDAQLLTVSAVQLWDVVRQGLQPVLDAGAMADMAVLRQAVTHLLVYNQKLLGLMNDLTTALEQNATREIAYLRGFQAGMLCLALLNFVLVCKRLLGRVQQSQHNERALSNIIDSIGTGIVLYGHDQTIRSANKAAVTLLGYAGQTLEGKPLQELLFNDDDRTLGIRRDNTTFIAQTNTQSLFEGERQIYICTIVDISEQQRKEERLSQLAFLDTLTGLPNRVLLKERLNQEILHAKRNSSLLAVFFVDLDGFKSVNDRYGHDTGDQLLQWVAKRFLHCCREDDTVARLGGDEFVFVLNAIHSTTVVKQVAWNILKSVNQDFSVGQHNIRVSVSIGIAIYPHDHTEADSLLKYADDAMYHAKQSGKNRFAFAAELR